MVTHPSSGHAQCCLTFVICGGNSLVYSYCGLPYRIGHLIHLYTTDRILTDLDMGPDQEHLLHQSLHQPSGVRGQVRVERVRPLRGF